MFGTLLSGWPVLMVTVCAKLLIVAGAIIRTKNKVSPYVLTVTLCVRVYSDHLYVHVCTTGVQTNSINCP